jgi:iron complex transport system substrate-binding protein
MSRPFVPLLVLALAGPAAAAEPYLLGELAGPPARIVTVAPSLTEVVLDLGEGGRLVGVSRYDDAPEVAKLPRVGGFLDPAPEAILGLRPDLVLAAPSPGNRGPVEGLARLGVPVLVLPLHEVPEILAAVREVARVLEVPARGEALAKSIADGLAAVRARTAPLPKRRVLVVYGWRPLVVAGPGSFADSLLADAGALNVAAGASGPYPTFSAEAALAAAPDLILDATGGHGGNGEIPPGLRAPVVPVTGTELFHPGPRIVRALDQLARLIHPEPKPGSGAAR